MAGTEIEMRASGDEAPWRAFLFYLCLLSLGLLLLIEGMGAEIDEGSIINARTLPCILSGIVSCYALVQCVLLWGEVRQCPFPRLRSDGLTVQIVMPLTGGMVAYVWIVQMLGYPIGTALTMIWVFWVFGVRRTALNVGLSVMAAAVAYVVFVMMLKMYMPEGWLLSAAIDSFSGR